MDEHHRNSATIRSMNASRAKKTEHFDIHNAFLCEHIWELQTFKNGLVLAQSVCFFLCAKSF